MKKYILISFLLLIALIAVSYIIIDEPLPEGESGTAADALAEKMLTAINHEAWNNTGAVMWTFPGGHAHLWDKQRHLARVRWDDYEVLVRLDSVSGQAFSNGQRINDADKEQELVQQAWEYWVNDSFWLNAPNKAFDPGVERQVIRLEGGEEALLVTYTSGGVTPGDSYLWLLDEDGTPRAWKLWVGIIPLGGVAFSWEGWQTLSSGARIATLHQGLFTLEIGDLQSARSVEALLGEDPFAGL